MSTSSPTRSTSTSNLAVIALGANLGDRELQLRRAIHLLGDAMRVVRVSRFHETEPVDAPPGSPRFLNGVVAGVTGLSPADLLIAMRGIEARLGRVRRGVRNEPRLIDLDLIAYGATRMATPQLTLPHPRAASRAFVTEPMRELGLEAFLKFIPGGAGDLPLRR